MTDLVRINAGFGIGLPVVLADGTRFIAPAMVLLNASGAPMALEGGTDLDTTGNVVPIYKGHTYTYDASGNIATDTVSDGSGSWVRTYAYVNGSLATDSGWVKQ